MTTICRKRSLLRDDEYCGISIADQGKRVFNVWITWARESRKFLFYEFDENMYMVLISLTYQMMCYRHQHKYIIWRFDTESLEYIPGKIRTVYILRRFIMW